MVGVQSPFRETRRGIASSHFGSAILHRGFSTSTKSSIRFANKTIRGLNVLHETIFSRDKSRAAFEETVGESELRDFEAVGFQKAGPNAKVLLEELRNMCLFFLLLLLTFRPVADTSRMPYEICILPYGQ
jgi:hypothetical protein